MFKATHKSDADIVKNRNTRQNIKPKAGNKQKYQSKEPIYHNLLYCLLSDIYHLIVMIISSRHRNKSIFRFR